MQEKTDQKKPEYGHFSSRKSKTNLTGQCHIELLIQIMFSEKNGWKQKLLRLHIIPYLDCIAIFCSILYILSDYCKMENKKLCLFRSLNYCFSIAIHPAKNIAPSNCKVKYLGIQILLKKIYLWKLILNYKKINFP